MIETVPEIEEINDTLLSSQLIVWNDDYNSFNHVINLLMIVVNHTFEQAEQCSLIIHYKGKCAVASGSYEELKSKKDLLTDGGLSVTIE